MSVETINTPANELDFSQSPTKASPKKKNRQRKQKETMSLFEFRASVPEPTPQPRLPTTHSANQNSDEQNSDDQVSSKAQRNRVKRELAKKRKAALNALPQEEKDKRQGWKPVAAEKKKPVIRKPDPHTVRGAQRVYRPDVSDSEKPNTTLVLKNLPSDCTNSKWLVKFFSKCGPVKYVNVLTAEGKCRGIGFVCFETREGSDKGLDMDGFWYDDQKVYVEYSRNKK